MSARATNEPHRNASQLELLFDLTFVVAVAAVTEALLHHLASDHPWSGVIPFLMVFFAIWWAWMNFTWFASSYDTDDVAYRLLTFVQMVGVLVLAAGVPAADKGDFRFVTLGYLIMRLGLVSLWWRVSREDPESRVTAHRYIIGISIAEVGWLSRLALDEFVVLSGVGMRLIFFSLVAVELAIPPWAERHRSTSWHPHHMAERYGLFVIILLGEGIVAASMGVNSVLAEGPINAEFLAVAIAGLVLVLSLWWLYFVEPCAEGLARTRDRTYRWRYGHYGVFASLAALGGGVELAVVHAVDPATGTPLVTGYAIAVPTATFLTLRWAVNRTLLPGASTRPALTVVPAMAILLLPAAAPITGTTTIVCAIAAGVAGIVAASVIAQGRAPMLAGDVCASPDSDSSATKAPTTVVGRSVPLRSR